MIFDTLADRVQGYVLKKACNQLHVPHMNIWLDMEVIGADGKTIKKIHQRSKSWTRNAYNIMFSIIAGVNRSDLTFGSGLLSLKDINGTVAAIINACQFETDMQSAGYCGFIGAGSSNNMGVCIGTGVTVESFEDYKLITPVAPGNGTGQFYILQSQPYVVSYGALTLTNTLLRYFNNNSGSAITIGEVALIGTIMSGGGFSGNYFSNIVFSRDKLAVPISVPDTAQFKVTYTINLVYPS